MTQIDMENGWKSSVEMSEVNDFSWDNNGGGFNLHQITMLTNPNTFNYKS